MTALPPPRRRTAVAWLQALVLLPALLLSALVIAAPSAAALAGGSVTSPAEGIALDAPFEVVVELRPDEGEVIDRVDVRLVGPSERTVGLEADGPPGPDGTQTWRTTVEPLRGLALGNGTYRITATAMPLVGDPAAIEGPQVRLVVPPPQRELTAQPAEGPAEGGAASVELAWDPVELPDFIGYRIQRRPDAEGGTWATIADLADPRTGTATDVVAEAGAYRYRLIVVRADGSAGELFATSDPRGVTADPAAPGTFEVEREPDPVPANTPEPTPTPTPTEATPAPAPQPQPPPPNAGVTVRPPSTGGQAPPAAPPAVAPLDPGTFEEILPFDLPEAGVEVGETESELVAGGTREGGTLAVLTEDPPDRAVWTATAGGLLLLVVSAHVRRFLAGGGGRVPRPARGRAATGGRPPDG